MMNSVISPLPGTPKRASSDEHEQDSKPIILFTGQDARLSCEYLQEPHLVFSDRHLCEDPKTGLAGFGPYSKSDVTRRTAIRIGVVGPGEAIDRALTLIRQMSNLAIVARHTSGSAAQHELSCPSEYFPHRKTHIPKGLRGKREYYETISTVMNDETKCPFQPRATL